MNNKPTIAGIVLTLNEEANVACALRSLAWCDELVVVDSGSTDATHSISQSYFARFYFHQQKPPFLITDQRNWALANCELTSDWVLFLDADEEVGPTLVETIMQTISSTEVYDAFELAPRYWFLGKWIKHTQGYPNWHPRLVRRCGVHFVGGVWEAFSPGVNVGRIYEPYEHYAFSKGIDDWIDRHKRYADWDARFVVNLLHGGHKYNARSQALRILSSRLWPFKPITRFFYKYFYKLGFLDGWQGLLFSCMMSMYELIVVVKILEYKATSDGKRL